MQEPTFVRDQGTLDDLCRRWRAVGCFAFDTEFIRDETYDAALCLVQVNVGGEVTLIDPTAELDLTSFWALVTDPEVVTVVHAGKEDFEVCVRTTGKTPRNVFDVQIAGGLVGHGYPLSLLRSVEMLLHRRIAKAQTLTDWLRRPLTPEQVRYAVEDVVYLPDLYQRLNGEIKKAGREAWAREEFARFEQEALYRPPAVERVSRLKGSKRLDGLGLLVLERLVTWRESWARERNRPLRAMMRDDVLVEIARRRPEKPRELEVLRGFPQARNRKVVQELLDIIADAGRTPPQDWPEPSTRREDTPVGKILLDLMSAVTQAICHDERVSWSLVGCQQRLRELMDFQNGLLKEKPALLNGWRAELVGARLIELLEGKRQVRVAGWPRAPRLRMAEYGSGGDGTPATKAEAKAESPRSKVARGVAGEPGARA